MAAHHVLWELEVQADKAAGLADLVGLAIFGFHDGQAVLIKTMLVGSFFVRLQLTQAKLVLA